MASSLLIVLQLKVGSGSLEKISCLHISEIYLNFFIEFWQFGMKMILVVAKML